MKTFVAQKDMFSCDLFPIPMSTMFGPANIRKREAMNRNTQLSLKSLKAISLSAPPEQSDRGNILPNRPENYNCWSAKFDFKKPQTALL
jgi:hypothetical protein